jgi:hypothetical protein
MRRTDGWKSIESEFNDELASIARQLRGANGTNIEGRMDRTPPSDEGQPDQTTVRLFVSPTRWIELRARRDAIEDVLGIFRSHAREASDAADTLARYGPAEQIPHVPMKQYGGETPYEEAVAEAKRDAEKGNEMLALTRHDGWPVMDSILAGLAWAHDMMLARVGQFRSAEHELLYHQRYIEAAVGIFATIQRAFDIGVDADAFMCDQGNREKE